MGLHLEIEAILDEAKQKIRALIASTADPVETQNVHAAATVSPAEEPVPAPTAPAGEPVPEAPAPAPVPEPPAEPAPA